MRFSFFVLLLSFVLAVPAFPQQSPSLPPPARRGGDLTPSTTEPDETRDRLAHDLEKKAAKERIAALKSDTDKLLKLSVELKQYVDKSNEDVLSLDVIRKADEIEKLAKSVKDKMKGPN